MSERNDGGPAFPVAEDHEVAADFPWTAGVTLRDYFAAKALPAVHDEYFAGLARGEYGCSPDWPDGIAAGAYLIADAMLKRRREK